MRSPVQPPTKVHDLRVVVLLIAVSVPVWLGIETLLRIYVLGPVYGPIFAELRAYYWPDSSPVQLAERATRLAWILIGVTALAGTIGVALLRPIVHRSAGELTTKKIRDTLLLMTSIPQVPGLLSTLCLLAGADPIPVVICVAVSTAFVIVQGFVGERLLSRSACTRS